MGRQRDQKRADRSRKAGGGSSSHPRNRLHLAQNFLTSETLVRRLVEKSGISIDDTVVDIGAGRGIITAELAKHARRVIAIEKDPRLVRGLRERFRAHRNVEIMECDFLRYRIAVREYKVFANIPYNQTAAIIRKMLDSPRHAPSEAYVVIQKEPARKFAGASGETLCSLIAKPYFDLTIVHHLRRDAFRPVPNVDSVMLKIVRRKCPIVDDPGWAEFVSYGFTRYKPNLRLAYKNVFAYKQWKHLSRELGFDMNATPSQLTFRQWLGLFETHRSARIE